jgi:hypothetical protein
MLPQQKAQAELDSATLHIETLKAHLVTRIFDRSQRLLPQHAISQQDCDECTESVNCLKCEIAEAMKSKKAAEASLGMAKYDFDHYQRIITPISGEVVAIHCSYGLVARSVDHQLVWVEVIDSTKVHICCSVSPDIANRLREMMAKKATLSILGTKCKATIAAVPRIIRNGLVPIILEADNSKLELVCGQEIKINLP